MPVREHLENGLVNNRDGSGWAVAVPAQGRIITGRDLDQRAALEMFLRVRETHPEGPALFHSRLATRGLVTAGNCHPFQCGTDAQTVLAHNGTMFKVPDAEKRSDTKIYAEQMFPALHVRLDRPKVRHRVEKFLGWSRLAVLTVNRRYRKNWYLFGEDRGVWVRPDGTQAPDLEPGVTGWHSNRDCWPSLLRYVHPASPDGTLTDGRLWLDAASGEFCTACQQEFSVNKLTRICRACGTCADCKVPVTRCVCFEDLEEVPRGAGV
jgi:predicted glutamine amidotransferase